MPAFLTHYALGVCAYRQMEDGTLRKVLKEHPSVYAIGLAGPDLFFYSFYELIGPGKRKRVMPGMPLGRMMHKYRTGLFLANLFDAAMAEQGEERDIALVYYTGFVGHYCLDSAAHPFIYRATDRGSKKQSLGRHFRFEAAIDAYTCGKRLGRPIDQSKQMEMVRISKKERGVISRVLARACTDTYGDIYGKVKPVRLNLLLREYRMITGLIIDPSGFREWALVKAEKRIFGYPWASPLFINGNYYGISEKSLKQFDIRFERGLVRMNLLVPLIESAAEGGGKEREKLIRKIGNRSYHTGIQAENL